MDYSKYKSLEFRRKFFKVFGAEIKMTETNSEQTLATIKMKAWKLKEDIRMFSGEGESQEVLRIRARSIMDLNTVYDIFSGADDKPTFSVKRKALSSAFLRDKWDLLDANGNAMGLVEETSGALALMRRWIDMIPIVGVVSIVFAFVPQTYKIDIGEKTVATITQYKNPIIIKMRLDRNESDDNPFIGIASAALMSVIDAGKD